MHNDDEPWSLLLVMELSVWHCDNTDTSDTVKYGDVWATVGMCGGSENPAPGARHYSHFCVGWQIMFCVLWQFGATAMCVFCRKLKWCIHFHPCGFHIQYDHKNRYFSLSTPHQLDFRLEWNQTVKSRIHRSVCDH